MAFGKSTSLSGHITGLRSLGAFKKKNATVPPVTGWRSAVGKLNRTVAAVTGHRHPTGGHPAPNKATYGAGAD